MFGNLLIKKLSNETLDTFVLHLSKGIGCGEFEQRQSSNYLEERYFRSSVLGIEIQVALADEAEFDSYDYWLSFQPDGVYLEDKEFFDGLADCVARKLATYGHAVIRPLNFGRSAGGAIVYRPNPIKTAGLRERVITENL